ncbi:MAG: hypothetical protein ABIT37_06150 [Luteolibacter sp.]
MISSVAGNGTLDFAGVTGSSLSTNPTNTVNSNLADSDWHQCHACWPGPSPLDTESLAERAPD